MFIQESESSHRANLVKNFLMKNLTKDLLKTLNAPPPTSLDCNSFDYQNENQSS